MSDPCFYREHECNISAPYVRGTKAVKAPVVQATTVNATNVNTDSLTFSDTGVQFYTGTFPLGTTHTFTATQIPSLASQSCNGELSLYLNNDVYVNVTMAVITRAKGVTQQALIYQNVGNFTSVVSSISGNNVDFTVSPAATCSWIFRGK
jgi:hypothetical protein